MQITFNTLNPEEVAEVKAVLGLAAEAVSYLPEDVPVPANPSELQSKLEKQMEAKAAEAAAKAAEIANLPETAPAAPPSITLDIIKAKVNEINLTDNSKLADVKAALDKIGVDKTSNLKPEQFEGFWNDIKDLV
jgi:hemolysin activation/secretion protein